MDNHTNYGPSGMVSLQKVALLEAREEHLRAEYACLRQLYEQAPFGYQCLDADGRLIEINQTWLQLTGYSREEVIGKNFREFLHPEKDDHFGQGMATLKKMGEIDDIEFKILKKAAIPVMPLTREI